MNGEERRAAIIARGLTNIVWGGHERIDEDKIIFDLTKLRGFRLMDSKFTGGECSGGCGEPIKKGERIAYGGPRDAWHVYCAAAVDDQATNGGMNDRGRNRGSYGRKRVTTIRTSGGTFYRNARGRCEDAPCCGCCTI